MADMFFIDTGNVNTEPSDKKSKKGKGKSKKSKTVTLEGSEGTVEQEEFQYVSRTNILGEESKAVEEETEEDDRPKSRRPQFRRSSNKRYHETTDNDIKVGVLSDALRSAMGLHRTELPFFIYRMRALGYPPGWLKDHEREKSGLSIVGEENTAEEQVEYDVDKFLSIPGFNAPLPPGIADDWKRFGALPMQKMHSLEEMRRALANGGRREPDTGAAVLSDRLDDGVEAREAMEGCGGGGGHKKKRKKKRRRQNEVDDSNYEQQEEPDVSVAKSARLEHNGSSENSMVSESELTQLEEERRRILDQLNSTQAEEEEEEEEEEDDDEEEEEMEGEQQDEEKQEEESGDGKDSEENQDSNGIDVDASEAAALTLAASLGSPVCLTPNAARQLPELAKFSVGIEEFRPYEDSPAGVYRRVMSALRNAKKK